MKRFLRFHSRRDYKDGSIRKALVQQRDKKRLRCRSDAGERQDPSVLHALKDALRGGSVRNS